MKLIAPLTLALFLLAPVAAEAQSKPKPRPAAKSGAAPKKIYCWEENGSKVCGDAMPASAANSARTEINAKTGNVTRSIDKAQTPEERAAIERQQRAAAAQQQQVQSQAERGQALLMTYGSEAALNMAFDERVETVKQAIAATQKQKKEAHLVLVDRLSTLGNIELSGKKPPKATVDDMYRLRAQVKQYDGILAGHEDHIQKLQAERATSLALYRATLQTLTAGAAPAPPSSP